MSVTETFIQIAERLKAARPAYGKSLTACLTELRFEINEADLPLGMLRLAQDTNITLSTEALGLGRIDATVQAYIFLAGPEVPLPEKDALSKYWPLAILKALAADITLGNNVAFIGSGSSPMLAICRVGVIMWNNTPWWGVTVDIPVTEKPVVTMA